MLAFKLLFKRNVNVYVLFHNFILVCYLPACGCKCWKDKLLTNFVGYLYNYTIGICYAANSFIITNIINYHDTQVFPNITTMSDLLLSLHEVVRYVKK